MKKILRIALLCSATILFALALIYKPHKRSEKFEIVTSNFPTYDFVRAITANTNINIKMLTKPGSDLHEYEPSPQDIIDIQNSKAFVCVGGESEEWLDSILDNIDQNQTKIIKIIDLSPKMQENSQNIIEKTEESGANEEKAEVDEHVWTSIKNSIQIIEQLNLQLSEKFPDFSQTFKQNSTNYTEILAKIDEKLENLTKSHQNQTLVFADRFPFAYFFKDYNLDYIAAFPGCAHESEASPTTITKLTEYVKEYGIHYIYTIELSDQKIARTIAETTGAEILTLNSAHNISAEDFENGQTYAEIMENNYNILEKSLK